ncbi:oligosaccharide flippase family protein [Nodosilinea sp. E11]|uniref:oligosaccharide flippase family protein n=1 Tax=Nodosilinea sp. E11 TaxID=3037479 RepID=UPI0029352CDD|nr:oligosaccharide flippase family protein [Nodosilinea sp. E11]WOD39161.1 oligosaccharide flippase family protein [Nodosilinea sp. E11]
MASIRELAVRGTLWTILGYGGSQILRFGSNLLLTRLLYPEFFGLMGIVNIFIIGLALFSDVGIGYNIIQNKRGDEPDFYNTAWTIQVIRGFGLWIICLAISLPVSQLYDQPSLTWLIPVVGLTTIFSGFSSTALFSLERHVNLKKQVIIEMGSQVIGLLSMLIWALISPTVWSLAVGGLISGITKMIWSHHILPDIKNRFLWEKESVKEILSVGRWVFISTATMFVAEQSDRIMLGAMFPLALFGIYQITLTLSDVPRQVLQSLSGRVMFPVVSKMVDQPRNVVIKKVLNGRRLLLIASSLMLAFLVGFGDILMEVLYDERYSSEAWMLPVLALGLWPRMLANTSEPYLLAIGQFQYAAYGNFLRLLSTVVGILIGFRFFQVPGAIFAVALNDLFYYLVITYGLIKEKFNSIPQDIFFTVVLLTIVTLLIMIRSFFGLGMPIQLLSL